MGLIFEGHTTLLIKLSYEENNNTLAHKMKLWLVFFKDLSLLNVYLVKIIFINLFYYLAYFYNFYGTFWYYS